MIATHPRLYRALVILIVLLALVCAWCWPFPLHAAAPPSLQIQSINDGGTPDLVPGQRLTVIIELRSEEAQHAQLQHLVPDGLTLEQSSASTGTLVTDPFPSWDGVISDTQPLIIVLGYRVQIDTAPGDRAIKVQAQVAGQLLRAENVLRVCCISAPPAQQSGAHPIRLSLIRA